MPFTGLLDGTPSMGYPNRKGTSRLRCTPTLPFKPCRSGRSERRSAFVKQDAARQMATEPDRRLVLPLARKTSIFDTYRPPTQPCGSAPSMLHLGVSIGIA